MNKADSAVIKEIKPEKLHKQAKEYLIFQLYVSSEYIYTKFGLDELKRYYQFNQESFFNLKLSGVLKLIEGVIKRLPKRLKIKEGLKTFIDQMQFLEPPKHLHVLEITNQKATFEITKCTVRKAFNKLAKKSGNNELIDKCCLWCIESIPYATNYGFEYRIELTEKGCLNYLE